jgi:hypothetical protein
VTDIAAWLLDDTLFNPRARCGHGWEPWLVAAAVTANLAVFGAYLAIPLYLLRAYWVTRARPLLLAGLPKWPLWAFALFIVACGIGHLWVAAGFRWPFYRFFTLWDVLTAVVSWATLGGLVAVVPHVREWRSPEEYQHERDQATAARERADGLAVTLARKNRELEERKERLEAVVVHLEGALRETREAAEAGNVTVWTAARHRTLDQLLTRVKEIVE